MIVCQTLTQRLEDRRTLLAPMLSVCWDRVYAQSDRRERFVAYMVEVYHYIKFSCPLMKAATDRLGAEYDPVRDYLCRHIDEERDHDRWMLDDLGRLGFNPTHVCADLPMIETVAFVGTQKYVIEHLNPIGLLGYIYALESSTSSRETVERLSRELELPIEALSTLVEHAGLDWNSHVADLREMLDLHITRAEDQNIVVWNYVATMEQLSGLVLAIAHRNDIRSSLARLAVWD